MKNRVLGAAVMAAALAPVRSMLDYARDLVERSAPVGRLAATHRTSKRTVAQDKRDARKRRNRLKAKRR